MYTGVYDQTLADRSDEINRKTIYAWKFVSKLFTDFAKRGYVVIIKMFHIFQILYEHLSFRFAVVLNAIQLNQ